MTNTSAAAIVVLMATSHVVASGCQPPDTRQNTTAGPDKVEFVLKSASGEAFDFAVTRGQPVILNFWATWCAPCRLEIPELIELGQELKDSVHVVGVSIDMDGYEVVAPFVEEFGIDYPVVVDTGPAQESVGGLVGVPNTFILDSTGAVFKRFNGLVSADLLREALGELGRSE